MTTARTNNSGLVLIIIAAFLVCGMLWLRNGQHADANHREAPSLRSVINDQAGAGNAHQRGLSLYFSESHGSLLILLHSGDGKAGGWVIKITEVTPAGIVPLGARMYERTCFLSHESYWNWVIARDGYVLLAIAMSIPALAAALVAALAIVVRKLRRDGHDALADHIEQEARRR